MSLQMLPAGQDASDVQVTRSDQDKINTFSKLNSRLADLEDLYNEKKNEKEYLDDVSNEIELIDEDELVPYKIGDAFYWLKQSEVVEKLGQALELTDSELTETDDKIRSIRVEMDNLKQSLYATFGNSINLER
ncbi:Prefoldin subunit-domain-containing protein [Limtongia smithiae]|uniref:Prefoldin subunit-domain-containing protein n=1 Tax=Limtongia smithiae TaxID=1125753 RepID=UPI0034CEA23D